jgi:hypothetical protein
VTGTRVVEPARPRGKAAGVPPAIRRLWQLLYRAERRTVVKLDELDRRLHRLEEEVGRLARYVQHRDRPSPVPHRYVGGPIERPGSS